MIDPAADARPSLVRFTAGVLKRALLLPLAALLLAVIPSSPAQAASCAPKGSTAILANEDARVFERADAKQREQFNVYVCRYKSGRIVRLGVRFRADPTGVGMFRLAGPYVA